ncbi:MAG: DNA repair protein RadC, partial [Acetobacteraceae bacterium]|nr:DNA repair protein RadC [Acetobacteraceae bacterium]
MLSEEIIAEGTVDHVFVESREVMRRALELRAMRLILVHN